MGPLGTFKRPWPRPLGATTEVPDTRRVEALRRSRREAAETLTLLETLQSTAPVGLGFVDCDFRYARVNDRLAEINGVAAADHFGRRVADVVPHLWPQIEHAYWAVLAGQTIESQPLEGVTAAEPRRLRSWLVSLYPVRIAEEVIGIGVVVSEITERNDAERAQRELFQDAIGAIGATGEARDPYTAGHQRGVAKVAVAVAGEMRIDSDQAEGISLAAIVHDIGKIAIPAEILARPGKLRPGGWELVKTHPQEGYEILRSIDFPWPVAQMVLQHHERLDGSGYPRGLQGDEILLGSRIIAVADVLDAMASHRPYRPALGIAAALNEIRRGRGGMYDADVVDACLAVIERGPLSGSGDASCAASRRPLAHRGECWIARLGDGAQPSAARR